MVAAQTQRDLKDIGAKFEKLDTPGAVINIGIDRRERTFVMGGNLGLPTYQVVLGFSGPITPVYDPTRAVRVPTRKRSPPNS
jgi:hypothetical protein